MKYVFGPVPSRRLGLSLGVDLTPFKTCTYDCIYCQLGCTTHLVSERKEWVPLDAVLAEIREKLGTRPDYITLGGSGEPTLYARLGELIDGIKRMANTPVAVLTNGSLLWDADIRAQLRRADMISPSLDAGDEDSFQAVNRPEAGMTFARMVYGLTALREEFRGQYWLEVFVLEGYTDSDEMMRKIADCAALIRPDRVQLNTVSRPAAEPFARGVTRERLLALARLFDPPAEVIADFSGVSARPSETAGPESVAAFLQRHPGTVCDVAKGLGLTAEESERIIGQLEKEGRVERLPVGGADYFRTRIS